MQVRTSWQIQRAVVFALVVRELKTRFGGRWLGAFWTLLEPLAHVLVYVFIFGPLRASRLPNVDYPVFLATGLLPFFAFRALTTRLADAISSNRALFSYGPVKPFDTIVARGFLEVALNSVVLVITFGLLSFFGDHNVVPHRPIEWISVLAVLLAFGFGLGLSFAIACQAFPRVRTLLSLTFLPLYMLSAIQMPIQSLPTAWHPVMLWNPLLHIFEVARSFFFPQYTLVDGITLAYPSALALVVLPVGLALYRVRRLTLLREA